MTDPRARRGMARRAWCLRAAAAALGFALAAALAGPLQGPAPPGQIPGAMTAMGLDAAGPFRQLAALILMPFACALASAPLARRLAGARGWMARWGRGVAPLRSLGSPALPAPPGARPVAPRDDTPARRTVPPPISRFDLLLLPTTIVVYFAILDLAPSRATPALCFLAAVLLTLGLRLAAGRISSLRRPGLALALAPLGVLLQLQWLPARTAAILALAWVVAAPLAVALPARGRRVPNLERRLRALVALAIYPLFVFAYPLALLGVRSPVQLDLFEDGHELLPAGEMLRGKLPYADVVPQHGLVSDGALDLLVLKSHGSTADVLQVRRVVRCANFAAIYAVALAATGSGEAGLLAALLSLALFPGMGGIRPAMALCALAAAVAAVRLRSLRWLAAAGAGAVLAFLVSPDFAAYSGVVAAVAALRSARRGRALVVLAAGVAAAAVATLAAFAAMGFAGAFLRVTFRELLPAGRAYIVGPLAGPACLRTLGTSLASWVQPECVGAILWILIVIATAAGLAGSPLRSTRRDGLWLVGLWIALAGAAYAERRHGYAGFAITAFLAGAVFHLARRRERLAAAALALAVAWLAHPFGHLFALATPLRASGGGTTAGVEVASVPRGRGVSFDPALRPALDSVARFVAGRLGPAETWLDFTNHPALYYLFDHNDPMRHAEVGFIETAAAQREVIAMLERDRAVRAALVGYPDWFTAIDGVPNSVRAPLLWSYLQTRFAPAYDEHGVVFWMRR